MHPVDAWSHLIRLRPQSQFAKVRPSLDKCGKQMPLHLVVNWSGQVLQRRCAIVLALLHEPDLSHAAALSKKSSLSTSSCTFQALLSFFPTSLPHPHSHTWGWALVAQICSSSSEAMRDLNYPVSKIFPRLAANIGTCTNNDCFLVLVLLGW